MKCKGGNVSRYIVKRFYNALEYLVDSSFLKEWNYCHRKSKPLTDDEHKKTGGYHFFKTLYINFELQNPSRPCKVIEDKKK